jgi:DNA-binding transcriptional ArsR family regulator
MAGRKSMQGLEQVRALSHPLRIQLIELFAQRPMTTKQAAELLRESPTKLYHHVAALERAGLVELRETRQNRGTTEKYFAAVSGRLALRAGAVAGSTPKDHAAMGMVVFDQSRNDLVRALAAGLADGRQPLIATRSVLRMSSASAKKLAAELRDLLRRLTTKSKSSSERATPSRGPRRRYSLTIALIPAEEP